MVFVKAPIRSRPSGQLVQVPGAELGRQIRHQGTKPVTIRVRPNPPPGTQPVCVSQPCVARLPVQWDRFPPDYRWAVEFASEAGPEAAKRN